MKVFVILFIFLLLFYGNAYSVNKITIVGLFKDRAIVDLDGKRRILETGKATPEGVTLISANSSEAVLEINGVRNRYELGTHIATEFNPPVGQKTVTIAPDSTGMYNVNGTINGFHVDFVVDTGATLISMNRHEARRLGIDYKLEGEPGVSNTASGFAKIFIVKIKQVKVGDIELHNIEGAVHDGDFPTEILLGNSFLNSVNMKREGKLLKLEQLY